MTSENKIKMFPPGSQLAMERGCECAVMDNHRGKGRCGDGNKYGWFLTQDCPLHGWSDDEED